MPTDGHALANAVPIPVVDEVSAHAGWLHKDAEAPQLAAPDRELLVTRFGIVNDCLCQLGHFGPRKNSPETHHEKPYE